MGGINRMNSELLLEKLGYSILCIRNNAELTIAYASGSFYEALGYRQGEITALRQPAADTVLRSEPPIDWKKVKDEIQKNGSASPELKLIKKNGHHIWAGYCVQLTELDGGECFCGIVTDITLKRRSLRSQREQTEELEALTANVPGGVMRCRAEENLTLNFVSIGFCRITGYSEEEIKERFQNRFIEMVYPHDRERLIRHVHNCTHWDDITEVTFRIVSKSGNVMWVLDKARCTSDYNGNMWLYGVLIDITAMKKAQDELAASEERYRLILDHVADPVFDCNFKTKELYYSPMFQQKFGGIYPDYGNMTQILDETDFVDHADRSLLFSNLQKLLHGKPVGDVEYRLKDRHGNYIWCNIHPSMFYDGLGMPTRLIAVISDIDRQKKENADLRQKAEHDLLTGLYNRITTTALVDEAIANSKKGDRHALFVIDIDNFKKVNDNLGHLCGDQLIVDTAEQIRRQFREDDIVGRIGGDEFVIFIKNINSELVLKKADVLQRMFVALRNNEKIDCALSGSIGVSFYPADGAAYDELFQKADLAMYAAKNGGKNSFRIYVKGIESLAHAGNTVR